MHFPIRLVHYPLYHIGVGSGGGGGGGGGGGEGGAEGQHPPPII